VISDEEARKAVDEAAQTGVWVTPFGNILIPPEMSEPKLRLAWISGFSQGRLLKSPYTDAETIETNP
jgi:hypothetical protein